MKGNKKAKMLIGAEAPEAKTTYDVLLTVTIGVHTQVEAENRKSARRMVQNAAFQDDLESVVENDLMFAGEAGDDPMFQVVTVDEIDFDGAEIEPAPVSGDEEEEEE